MSISKSVYDNSFPPIPSDDGHVRAYSHSADIIHDDTLAKTAEHTIRDTYRGLNDIETKELAVDLLHATDYMRNRAESFDYLGGLGLCGSLGLEEERFEVEGLGYSRASRRLAAFGLLDKKFKAQSAYSVATKGISATITSVDQLADWQHGKLQKLRVTALGADALVGEVYDMEKVYAWESEMTKYRLLTSGRAFEPHNNHGAQPFPVQFGNTRDFTIITRDAPYADFRNRRTGRVTELRRRSAFLLVAELMNADQINALMMIQSNEHKLQASHDTHESGFRLPEKEQKLIAHLGRVTARVFGRDIVEYNLISQCRKKPDANPPTIFPISSQFIALDRVKQ